MPQETRDRQEIARLAGVNTQYVDDILSCQNRQRPGFMMEQANLYEAKRSLRVQANFMTQ